MKRLLLGLVIAGCGNNDAVAPDARQCIVDPSGAASLTSTSFASCAAIPAAQTCAGPNTSPPLRWSGLPSGTQSIAVVLTDQSIDLVHWVIYDIPATATGLPAGVENTYAPANVPGAHQTTSYDSQTRGYKGPCPPETHIYQFAVHALSTAPLTGSTEQTTAANAIALIQAQQLASATLTGTYTP